MSCNIEIREYTPEDLNQMVEIWNEVVEEGIAFPQEEFLTEETGSSFFASQSYTAVAEIDGKVKGLYILHPNNVGRCGHICNASYAVASDKRGCGIGRALVIACMEKAKQLRFGVLQFNAVVATNTAALSLYASLGFTRLGVIPKGFRMPNGAYEDIIPHYISLL